MTLPDANLLIYAVNADAKEHEHARAWLESLLSGSDDTALTWTVLLAFLRITTHPRIMTTPLSPEGAMDYVNDWLELPTVTVVSPGPRHWHIFRNLVDAAGTAGNLTSDAHLAAIAIEFGATLCSADNDFHRFPGLRYRNPIARI